MSGFKASWEEVVEDFDVHWVPGYVRSYCIAEVTAKLYVQNMAELKAIDDHF